MTDAECVEFLRWALPRLGLRWPGFRKVRGQVCKRIARRMADLNIDEISEYRDYLETREDEWRVLDSLCLVTISRFYRDRQLYRFLALAVLPDLARRVLHRGEDELKVWSAGCGSGEEPFTIALIWRLQLLEQFPELSLRLFATDSNPAMRQRVGDARYTYSSVKDLRADWRDSAFTRDGKRYCLKPEFKCGLHFSQQDLRQSSPADSFDLVLGRNLAFTYFDKDLQRCVVERISAVLKPGGALVIGIHECLPEGVGGFDEWSARQGIYRRTS